MEGNENGGAAQAVPVPKSRKMIIAVTMVVAAVVIVGVVAVVLMGQGSGSPVVKKSASEITLSVQQMPIYWVSDGTINGDLLDDNHLSSAGTAFDYHSTDADEKAMFACVILVYESSASAGEAFDRLVNVVAGDDVTRLGSIGVGDESELFSTVITETGFTTMKSVAFHERNVVVLLQGKYGFDYPLSNEFFITMANKIIANMG